MVITHPPIFPDGAKASYGRLQEQQSDRTARLRTYLSRHRRSSLGYYLDYNGGVIFSKDPRQLAYEGFRFTGYFDISECAACFLRAEHWDPDDDVREIHEKMSPNCPFHKSDEDPDGWMLDESWTSSKQELYRTKEARVASFATFDFLTLKEKVELASSMFFVPAQRELAPETLECVLCLKAVEDWGVRVKTACSKHRCELNALLKLSVFGKMELRPLPHRVKH